MEGASDQAKGICLAVSSSIFIGVSFIIKKKGLRRAGASGIRAGSGGYSYLVEPLWWIGLLSMVVGEAANFAAYAFAPAIIVTPLGALSILVTAVASHHLLRERLNALGVLGCVLCVTGSVGVAVHAPEAHAVESVAHAWALARAPGFALYVALAVAGSAYLAVRVPPERATASPLVYVTICSAVGSLSVVFCQALGIAAKLTLSGDSQLGHPATYGFLLAVVACVLVQMNYLNKALDLFNPAVVTPLYYVAFTTLTILASAVMFRLRPPAADALAQGAGFLTIVCGTTLLQATKDLDVPASALFWGGAAIGGGGKGGAPTGGGAATPGAGGGLQRTLTPRAGGANLGILPGELDIARDRELEFLRAKPL